MTNYANITFGRSYLGIDIIEDENMTVTTEDCSQVRSPSRAQRRRKRGFPQRIKYVVSPSPAIYRVGDKVVMHPEMGRQMRAKIAQQMETKIEQDFYTAFRA